MSRINLSFLGDLSSEDKLLANNTVNWVSAATERYVTKYSFFLDERQRTLCERILISMGFADYRFYGGYAAAERTILGIFPPYHDEEDFPIVPLTFTYRSADTLSHRDFLGCIMSLRVARETVGDIIVGEGRAAAFVFDTVAPEIERLEKIGRVGVRVTQVLDNELISASEKKYKEISGTVASLRLDCVLALALKISRERSSALIKGKGAEVNHISVNSADRQLSAGDVFSVRGFGKFRLDEVGELTKKDRIHIIIQKYV